MKLFRILDPFTLTLITVVLLASFSRRKAALCLSLKALRQRPSLCCFLCMARSFHVKRSSLAAATGGCICGSCAALLCSFLSSAYCLPGGRLSMSTLCSTAAFCICAFLPATVQSAIAFTSLAGGNVAAAVCSASASSLLGIFLSPLLVGLVMNIHGAQGSLEEVGKIMLQLLLPFVLGHLSRPWIGNWVARNKKWIAKTDQTSILLVVYSAFSEAVVNGIWHKVGWGSLLFIVVVSLILLAIVIAINVFVARKCGFNKADEITIVFCGSKKPGQWDPDGQYSVSDVSAGYDGITADDLPPDPTDGLRRAGAALQTPDREVTGAAGKPRRESLKRAFSGAAPVASAPRF